MTPFELQMSHAKFSLLSRREFQSISRVLEHRHCSCPLAGRLEKHRARLARPRCGPHHVSAKFSFCDFFFLILWDFQFQTSLVSKQARTAEVDRSPDEQRRHLSQLSREEGETENIYEVIRPEGGRKISAAETLHSCINISSRRNYKHLDSSIAEDGNLTLNKLIFCFSCLCD